MNSEVDQVKYDVAVANRLLARVGLAAGIRASLGHASMRFPSDPNRFAVKGRGYRVDALSRMRPDDMVICDLEAALEDGPPGVIQCNEVKIHSCIYKARPDVQAVVHVHPKFTVLMSILQARLVPMAGERTGLMLVKEPLPVYPHTELVTTEEQGEEVAGLLSSGQAVLLLGHGAVTAGSSLQDAVMTMMHLEHQAEMNYLAYCAMGPNHPAIPEALVEEVAGRRHLEAPHLKAAVAKVGGVKYAGGAWTYLTESVARGL